MEPMITTHFPMWGYLIIIMSVFTILCISAICLWKYKLKILQNMPCLVIRKPKIRIGLKAKPNIKTEEDGDNEVEIATSLLTDIERPMTSNRIIKEKFVVLDTK